MLLKKLCKKYEARKLDSPLAKHFLDVYEEHFSGIRLLPLKILEIGVQYGGSLKMWAKYFPNSQITGLDIDKHCKKHGKERINVVIGDQADPKFLATLGNFDIIIDDGGHKMFQQQISLIELWKHLKRGGTYVLEDLETSYWPAFGGAYGKKDTTIEVLKNRVDNLNHAGIGHKRAEEKRKEIKTLDLKSIHFYPSLCLLKRI